MVTGMDILRSIESQTGVALEVMLDEYTIGLLDHTEVTGTADELTVVHAED